MFEWLEKLRNQPEPLRRAIAFWISLVVSFVIGAFWLSFMIYAK